MIPKVSTPVTFTPEQLQNVQVPVLLVIGEKDRLTSDPEAVKELAQNVPDIQIEVLDTGHLIGVEQPDRVNALIVEFFEQH
jgi:pimeloyl-ACP methyl ester carboxylesterase